MLGPSGAHMECCTDPENGAPGHLFMCYSRLEKLGCPRVNDDKEIDVGDQKLNSGRQYDTQIFKKVSCKKSIYFPYFIKVLITFQMKSNVGD